MTLITPAEFERRMKEIKEIAEIQDDEEYGHMQADALLVETLNSMGYEAGTEVFRKMGKRYG